MRLIKRIFLIIVILTFFGFIFREFLYRNFVKYKSIGQRSNYVVADYKLINYLNQNADNENLHDIKQIIKLSLLKTSKQLNFTTDKNSNDPNQLITTKTANCVGYASFFEATCKYFLKKHNLSDLWVAKIQIGQIYFCGINIHKFFDNKFYKDHDFVTIENKSTGQIFAVDPTINDYLFINFITYK